MINLDSILRSRDIILPTKVCVVSESHSIMSNSVTPWTVQFMEFSRPEYWSG